MICAQCMWVWRYHCNYHQLLKCVLLIIIKTQENKELEISKTSSWLLMVREELDLNDLILLTGSVQSLSLQKWLFLSLKHALQTQFYRGCFFWNASSRQILTLFKVKKHREICKIADPVPSVSSTNPNTIIYFIYNPTASQSSLLSKFMLALISESFS